MQTVTKYAQRHIRESVIVAGFEKQKTFDINYREEGVNAECYYLWRNRKQYDDRLQKQ
jgi:hypothetical protein